MSEIPGKVSLLAPQVLGTTVLGTQSVGRDSMLSHPTRGCVPRTISQQRAARVLEIRMARVSSGVMVARVFSGVMKG